MELRWVSCNALTGQHIGQLDPISWRCNDPLTGAGSCELVLPAPNTTAQRDRLRALTALDTTQLVLLDELNRYLWTGVLTSRRWAGRADAKLTVGAADWRSWFYTRLRTNADYIAFDKQQVTIFSDLLTTALAPASAPRISVAAAATDGVLQTITVRKYDNIGQALDTLTNAASAPEWWVTGQAADTGTLMKQTALLVRIGMRGSGNDQIAAQLDASQQATTTAAGGNIVSYEWPEETTERRTRIWALGEGQPPDQIVASDTDPDLGSTVLLRESASGPYTGVMKVKQAFQLARSERLARSAPIQSTTVVLRADLPHVGGYATGDRVRLRILDGWLDVSEPAVRILDRELSGGRGAATQAALTLDLNDREMPQGA